jgi:pyridoxal phosphate enzyme (YggS family)
MTTPYQQNLDEVIENIEFARLQVNAHHIVKIVAVSKYSTAEEVKSLLEVGQRAFGENKVQDLLSKAEALEAYPIEWHFIGNLQKNKINNLINANPMLMQSLDSLELAVAMNEKLAAKNQSMDMLVQVNSANEETKSGLSVDQTLDTYTQIQESCSNINLKGLMSIGAHTEDKTIIQKSFERTRALFDKLPNNKELICSMGMSGDYELAIACGSNMVRIGSKLFK